MTVQTKAFGPREIEERQIIRFPRGVFGFEHLHEYALIDSEQPPFYWLQSVAEVQTAFVLINPYMIKPDYVLDVSPADIEEIGSPPQEDILVFAIVTIPSDDFRGMTANLQGPVVINRKAGLGKQCIHLDAAWPIRHRILAGASSRGET